MATFWCFSIGQEAIDNHIQLIGNRNTPLAQLADFENTISSYLLAQTDDENFRWSSKQAYIGLGTGLIAAATFKFDAAPMEGFDSEKFDRLLRLKEKKLKSVVLLALGYRDEENDHFAKLKKVRWPENEFVSFVK